jgi:hypothetical protein
LITDFYFTFAEPYYEDEFKDFGTYHMRIFFKYTNDNNPFNEASISPLTVMDGVSQIGGFFAILGLLKLFLFFYNQSSFEKSLQKKYKQLITDHNEGKDIRPSLLQNKELNSDMIDGETIKESLSYELLMQLAIMQHDIIQTASKHEAFMAQLSLNKTTTG